MNTSALKRFAQQARNILKSGVAKQLLAQGYDPKSKLFTTEPHGVFGGALMGDKMIDDPTFIPKWNALQKAVRSKGAEVVYEEAAYTWFNRLMAIRILEKNGYIAPQLEFVSQQVKTPILVQAARQGNAPRLDTPQRKQLERLLDDDRLETELFALLISAYCHQSDLLQRVFGRLDDYTELLLPADILATNGFLDVLNTTDAITDDDYRQVELIGWLYQFYISEKKAEVDKKPKVIEEDIPAATQIFTPNWIVKYMVQNTVGRIWLDLNPDSHLRESMKYLVEKSVPEATDYKLPITNYRLIKEVAHLKLLDPACGSGHILVEGFDLLYSMYREEGYTAFEAVRSIFENNLFGLDIDLRAAQLSNFALLLKATAATQDPTLLEKNILPQVYAMPEKEIFTRQEVLDFLGEANATHADALYNALVLMQQSQNLGSVMKFSFSDAARNTLVQQTAEWKTNTNLDLLQQDLWKRLAPYMQVLQVLTTKYEAVAANPPYLVSGKMNNSLLSYAKIEFPLTCGDLSSIFMDIAYDLIVEKGYFSMINQSSWAFKTSYLKFRDLLIEKFYIETFLELGARTFDELSGEVVQSVCFSIKKTASQGNIFGNYYKLTEPKNSIQKEQLFLKSKNLPYRFKLTSLEYIPEKIFGYWLSPKAIEIFSKSTPICNKMNIKKGIATGDDSYFFRLWHELNIDDISFNSNSTDNFNKIKWFPINKGGGFRKWAGNIEYVVNWLDNGKEIKSFKDENGKLRSRPQNLDYIFRKGITYNIISSKSFIGRYTKGGFMMADVSPTIFDCNEMLIMPLLNSVVGKLFFKVLCPSYKFDTGAVGNFPLLPNYSQIEVTVNSISLDNFNISSKDWNSRETSWEFQKHPLINYEEVALESAYQAWEESVTQEFYQLHANETELNRIFIDIYGLHDELTPEVKLKNISILQEELDFKAFGDATEPIGSLPIKQEVVMRQLISYLVGCLMGRYRLNKPSLQIAHPSPIAEEIAEYSYQDHTVEIDDDGIIPLMDSNSSFADNVLIRLKHLLEAQWGGDKRLVDTINYLQSALGKDLESYLVKDFWKDHCSRYQKRPIYWLFASPKGAFQVITYMHRMNKYTVEKIRSNYLLRHISNLENRIAACEADQSSLDRNQMRDFEKLKADLIECREYDLQLKEVADQQIDFDLDDGVVVNYAKFGNVVAAVK